MVVHLPIGALLCLFILEIIVSKTHMVHIRGAVLKFIVVTAIPAVLAGTLLASSGSYGSDVFNLHKWFGVATALLSIWLYVIHKKDLSKKLGRFSTYQWTLFVNVILLSIAGHYGGSLTHGSDYLTKNLPQEVRSFFGDDPYALKGLVAMNSSKVDKTLEAYNFEQDIRPVVDNYCVQCHGPEEQKAGLRLDSINADLVKGPDAATWRGMLDMINSGEMPPEEEEQLTDEERRMLVDWITASVQHAIKIKKSSQAAVIRRLTKKQYTNSLNNLLGVSVDFGDVLPDDEKSEMGFSNNGHELQTSPLHIEYYKQIAREALDKAIVAEDKPKSTHYKIRFGKGIGEELPAAMIGGYQSAPINSDDFIVDILDENGMPIQPKDSVEEAYYTEVKKNVGVGMRGSHADRYEVVEDGVILYSALPHKEVSPKSWQGPSPNLKLLVKDYFPMDGDFEFRVKASKGYQEHVKKEGLISLRRPIPAEAMESTIALAGRRFENKKNLVQKGMYLISEDLTNYSYAKTSFVAPKTGYYQLDFTHPYAAQDGMPSINIRLDQFRLQERLHLEKPEDGGLDMVTPLTLAYLEEGKHNLEIGGRFFVGFGEVIVTPFPDDHPVAIQLDSEEEESKRKYDLASPIMRVFAGTRTDDGIDYKNFDDFRNVINSDQPRQYIFSGRLEDLPIPVIDTLETEILANIMGMGVWNDYLVKDNRDSGPPLLVHEIEFEAPYHPVWPPQSHTEIFFDSPDIADKEKYTSQVLANFMEKAFRRPLEKEEVETYMSFWRAIKDDYGRYEDGVKEVLVAILCSPNFIYLAEPEKGTSDDEREFFLASRLSYFLWDSPPDQELLALADRGKLHRKKELKKQVQRMLQDDKIWEMVRNFSKEWLRLDRHESMSTNVNEYEDYSRFVKRDMAEETYHFVHHVLNCNMYLGNLIESDFAMLNQNLAEFYGIDGVKGNHFRPVALGPDSKRGGLLSQGSFLSGHSDGTQAHAIKRAVWLRSRILGDRPPDPPPNVPELDPETPGFEKLTLKEQLFLHRNKVSCMDCHAKIDPYGIVFENYNAVGLFQTVANNGNPIDVKAELPDGKVVDGIDEIKAYILNEKIDDFTRSLVKHLFSYAVGRDVTFVDEPEIESIVSNIREDGYRFQSVFEHIITSKSFIGDF
ncbi:DUF1592 domain-containing protein [Flagellimonas myxillae]|uniref:DUF1592 domain-containing protein n=1 Tax=Flagellimonas myxillae TaxID=2942214 RepID=UPI00201EACD4|nr:DUF1592 domain-containing protein [Muricauda myxillae]MCL6265847.1 DUF1592 domain-containing protein [Muricauda myxillae]